MKNSFRQIFDSVRNSALLRECAGTSAWAAAARFCWIFHALTVGIYVTRVLGPARLGQLNYALSVTGLLCVFLMMQCNQVLVRHFVRNPRRHAVFLGSNFVFRLMTLGVSALTLAVTSCFLRDPEIRLLILILFLGQSFTVFLDETAVYFTAASRLRFDAYSQLCACGVYSVLRLAAAFWNLPVVWYAWIEAANSFTMLLLSWHFYRRDGFSPFRWTCDRRIVRCIFVTSVPLFLTVFTGALYAKTDIVMLEHFRGSETVGWYSLSARFTENMMLLCTMLTGVFTPILFQSAKVSEERFRIQLHRLYALMFWSMAGVVVLTELFAFAGVRLLYGKAFLETAPILRIFIVSLLFFAVSGVFSLWCVQKNRLYLGALLNLAGLLINIPMNWVLIQKYSAEGAAAATLISAPLGMALVLLSFRQGRSELGFLLKSIITPPSFRFSK